VSPPARKPTAANASGSPNYFTEARSANTPASAAYQFIEERLMPVFARQQANRRKRLRLP